ncbi:hypothetical protein DNX69_06820 [Rhodopseudomonas palustris]|uniref:Uncharacterized protein n=1 Tax=Rhodopseudomonas palustris TaxID=1076 RepID=A0A323UXX5_RHOPL|nr:hypothetical protein [Rhodopseudomonas palustris]PZA12608.1 hypothetical protein DNX69_06820 [Rhodopseudomonas palustris]
MIKQIVTCAILSTALTTAAFAAGPGAMDSTKNAGGTGTHSSTNNSNMQTSTDSVKGSQSAQNLPQQIRTKLQSAGFSDVKVVPQTFAVSAKDRDGDPVMMMIGPHSMAIIQAMNSSDSQTTGSSSSSSGQSGSSSTSRNNK